MTRNAILDTLELVLDPLGSTCEFFDSLDPDNPDNFVLKTAKAWQEGDSLSRGRIVGNVTGQVVIALTPVIAKKFAKIPTELGEARAVKVEPGVVSIAGEVKQGSHLKPNLQLFAQKQEETLIDAVINETLSSKGNITSKYILDSDEVLLLGEKLLGNGYQEVGKIGSGVFEKIVGEQTYRFRIDVNSLSGAHPPRVPHVHVEILNSSRRIIVNNHIPLKE